MTNANLPGAELIEQGLSDLAGGSETVESLLVSIGAIDPPSFRRAVDAILPP